MKKLMICAVAAIAASVASADTVAAAEKNRAGVLVTNTYDSVEYAEKLVRDKVSSGRTNEWTITYNILHQTRSFGARREVDAILSANRFYTDEPYFAGMFPKTFANYAVAYSPDCPELVPIAEHVVANPSAWDSHVRQRVCRAYYELSTRHFLCDSSAKMLLYVAPQSIRKRIRSEGGQFVTTNGVDAVQARMAALSAALNAARLSGLDAALAGCGMDFGLSFESKLMPASEVEALKAQVMSIDVPFDVSVGRVLRTHLGVDGYNAFVRLYNTGE